MNDADLARLLSLIADSLERQDQASSCGIVRQAAQRIAQGTFRPAEDPSTCAGCGAPIIQPATGRPRKWCGRGVCEARKTPEKSTLAS